MEINHKLLPLSVIITVVLILLIPPNEARAQIGLRPLQPHSHFNNSGSNFIFNRWNEHSYSDPRYGEPAIEKELAAIFRDLAYGDSKSSSTTEVTSTTASTTTTPLTSTKIKSKGRSDNSPSIVISTNWQEKKNLPAVNNNDFRKNQGHLVTIKNEIEKASTKPFILPITKDNFNSQEETVTVSYTQITDIKNDQKSNELLWLSELGVLWEVHYYLTAIAFTALLIVSLYCLTRIYLSNLLLPRGYYLTVNLLILFSMFLRCIYFYYDPYHISRLLPIGLSNVLFYTAIPCMTTATAVLIFGILKLARVTLLPFNFQALVILSAFNVFLIVTSIIINLLSGLKNYSIILSIKSILQAIILGWETAVCVGYIVIFFKIENSIKKQQNEIFQMTTTKFSAEVSISSKHPKYFVKFSARLALIGCLIGLVLSAFQMYGIFNTEMVIVVPPSHPNMWLTYNSICRMLEVTMWTFICVACSLPGNWNSHDPNQFFAANQILPKVICKKCCSFSEIGSCLYSTKQSDDMYATICQTSHVARHLNADGKHVPHDTIAKTNAHGGKQINTMLLPTKYSMTKNKTFTLQPNAPDAHLIWSENSFNYNLDSPGKPSSLVLTEEGLVQFRNAPFHASYVNDISHSSNSENSRYSSKSEYENTSQCDKLLSDSNYSADTLEMPSKILLDEQVKLGKNGYIPLSDRANSDILKSPMNDVNNFNSFLYDEDTYQSSSNESCSHIYASVVQPNPHLKSPNRQFPPSKSSKHARRTSSFSNNSTKSNNFDSLKRKKQNGIKYQAETTRTDTPIFCQKNQNFGSFSKVDLLSNSQNFLRNDEDFAQEIIALNKNYVDPLTNNFKTHNLDGFSSDYNASQHKKANRSAPVKSTKFENIAYAPLMLQNNDLVNK